MYKLNIITFLLLLLNCISVISAWGFLEFATNGVINDEVLNGSKKMSDIVNSLTDSQISDIMVMLNSTESMKNLITTENIGKLQVMLDFFYSNIETIENTNNIQVYTYFITIIMLIINILLIFTIAYKYNYKNKICLCESTFLYRC